MFFNIILRVGCYRMTTWWRCQLVFVYKYYNLFIFNELFLCSFCLDTKRNKKIKSRWKFIVATGIRAWAAAKFVVRGRLNGIVAGFTMKKKYLFFRTQIANYQYYKRGKNYQVLCRRVIIFEICGRYKKNWRWQINSATN